MNEVVGLVLIGIGIVYDLFACLGLVRMPDIYTRLQTATKAVTAGTSSILIGVVIYSGPGALSAQALLCMIFVLLTNPVSAHVIARAAHSYGIRVERVTADGLVGRKIESELWDLTRKRDRSEKDRLVSLFMRCPILEIEQALHHQELFERVSHPLGEAEGVSPDTIKEKLIQREKEAVTALIPDFAIPHIIIDGKGTFEILVARAREGVWFSERCPKVRSVFIIVGTQDEWHFHLRTLAAIARIVSADDFFEEWVNIEDTEGLRDMLIKRTRDLEKGAANASL